MKTLDLTCCESSFSSSTCFLGCRLLNLSVESCNADGQVFKPKLSQCWCLFLITDRNSKEGVPVVDKGLDHVAIRQSQD